MGTNVIGVLMIARDEERYLEDALAGIEGQTRQPDVVVMVDDQSRDSTRVIMKEFALRSSATCEVVNGPGKGRAAASNLGLTYLRAHRVSIVVIADGDDISKPHRIQRIEDHFRIHPRQTVHAGQMIPIGSCGEVRGIKTAYPVTPEATATLLRRGRTAIPHAAAAFRMSFFDALEAKTGTSYAENCSRVQDLELLTAGGSLLDGTTAIDVDIMYRSDSTDLSLRNWVAYRPRHHYSISHGKARRRSAYFPPYEEWWKSMSRRGKLRKLDLHLFVLNRLRRLTD